ncbi:MAG TPA: hypothetical protein DCE18_14575, partial [Syntrophobacteraceae bacterium]|nr:hypothetical protein [Syntrophobacteraceae bacterium]
MSASQSMDEPQTQYQPTAEDLAAIAAGNWMVRASRDGVAYGGFVWNPVGMWTEAPDWDERQLCGGGLHGQGPEAGGYITGHRLDLCVTDGPRIIIDGNKIKVPRAKIIQTDTLIDGLTFLGNLNLQGTQITQPPENLTVGG